MINTLYIYLLYT